MPLDSSASKEAREKNIKTEIAHGKDPKQAVAIGYSKQRENKKKEMKMGDGGMAEEMFKKGVHHKEIPKEHLVKPKHAHHGHHEGKNDFKMMAKDMPKLGAVPCGKEMKPKMGKKK